jgi:hypothetical protein
VCVGGREGRKELKKGVGEKGGWLNDPQKMSVISAAFTAQVTATTRDLVDAVPLSSNAHSRIWEQGEKNK